jgi:predicted Zn-dependent protease
MTHRLRTTVLFTLVAGATFAQDSAQLSTKREVMVGDQMAATIRSHQPMVTDVEVTAFVDRVLGTLSRNEVLRLPIKITLLDNSDLIASALPGGNLVLSSGAILRADSEAEVAGLLSHALGHVQAGTFYVSNATIPTVFVGDRWGTCRRTSGGALMPLGTREQSSLFEAQADMLGLGYITNAGYDPQALVSVFDHWTGKFAPADDTKTRALALRNVAANQIENTSDFDRIKARLTPPKEAPRRAPTLVK